MLAFIGFYSAIRYNSSKQDEKALLYGDVNNDGIISNADVTLVRQYVADMVEFDTYQKIAADVNGDGKISMLDVVMIQQVLSGQLDGFPVGDYFMY